MTDGHKEDGKFRPHTKYAKASYDLLRSRVKKVSTDFVKSDNPLDRPLFGYGQVINRSPLASMEKKPVASSIGMSSTPHTFFFTKTGREDGEWIKADSEQELKDKIGTFLGRPYYFTTVDGTRVHGFVTKETAERAGMMYATRVMPDGLPRWKKTFGSRLFMGQKEMDVLRQENENIIKNMSKIRSTLRDSYYIDDEQDMENAKFKDKSRQQRFEGLVEKLEDMKHKHEMLAKKLRMVQRANDYFSVGRLHTKYEEKRDREARRRQEIGKRIEGKSFIVPKV